MSEDGVRGESDGDRGESDGDRGESTSKPDSLCVSVWLECVSGFCASVHDRILSASHTQIE